MRAARRRLSLAVAVALAGHAVLLAPWPEAVAPPLPATLESTVLRLQLAAPPAPPATAANAVAEPAPVPRRQRENRGHENRGQTPVSPRLAPPPAAGATAVAQEDGGQDDKGQTPISPAESASVPDFPVVAPNLAGHDNPPPAYPLAARRRGAEGLVLLEVRVAPDGAVAEVALVRSSGHALLDRAARRAVAAWRFNPARQGPRAVTGTIEVPVRFQLSDS